MENNKNNNKNNFTFVVTYNPEDNPDELGEFLRNEFFDQDKGGLGCYSNFDLREDVVELPNEPVDTEWDYDLEYSVSSKIIDGKKVIMKYVWDGDGVLEFHFEDGSMLYNGDCKKDYVWEYLESEE